MALRVLINGGFQDPSGAVLASGTVSFQLTQDFVASSSQIGAGVITSAPLDANGNVAGLVYIWAPATYFVSAFSATGQLVWQSILSIPDSSDPYSLTPGVALSALLKEDGTYFLLEDGTGIVLLET